MQLSLQGTQKGHKHKQHKHSSPNRASNAGAAGVYISPLEAGFRVTPAEGVLFDSYELGGAYFQTVQLQNVTNVMKGLRLLPPASRYFQISLPRWVACTSGSSAPNLGVLPWKPCGTHVQMSAAVGRSSSL